MDIYFIVNTNIIFTEMFTRGTVHNKIIFRNAILPIWKVLKLQNATHKVVKLI